MVSVVRSLLQLQSGLVGAPGRRVVACVDGDPSLYAVDLEGAATQLEPKEGPIAGIAPAADGRVFVGSGLAHLGGLHANVGYFDGDWKWTTVASSSNYDQKHRVGWNLEPDLLNGIVRFL